MREGYGACRKAVRSAAKHRSERVVRSSPTRGAAKGHAQEIKIQFLII
ncbi:MAG: hypothetical protein NZ455_16675 [Bacteroidia bacterium]|nr:hypothetical protein [Bacteroidia bacterium]